MSTYGRDTTSVSIESCAITSKVMSHLLLQQMRGRGDLGVNLVGSDDVITIGGKACSVLDASRPMVHVQAQAAVQLGLGLIQPLPHQ